MQLATQSYLHIRMLLSSTEEIDIRGERLPDAYAAEVDVSMSDNRYASNNGLLAQTAPPAPQPTGAWDLERATYTPMPAVPKHDLVDEAVIGYIRGGQQRKCTLCLEALRDPAATQCMNWHSNSVLLGRGSYEIMV